MNTLPIQTVEDYLKVGEILCRSGMFGVDTPEAGAAVAMMIHMEGMTILQFRSKYHILSNGPTMRADWMVAEFIRLGGKVEIITRDAHKAEAIFMMKDGKPQRFALTIDEVIASGICYKKDGKTLSNQWQVRPKNMLWARLVSDAIRTIDPRVNAGQYTEEEMLDEQEEQAAKHRSSIQQEPVPKQMTQATTQPKKPEPAQAPQPAIDDPFAAIPEDTTDYSVCPIGRSKGKKWTELSNEVLERVIKERPAGISERHIEEAKKALDDIPF